MMEVLHLVPRSFLWPICIDYPPSLNHAIVLALLLLTQ